MYDNIDENIEAFRERIEVDGKDFCLELFDWATVRLLACKYAYYVLAQEIIKDIAYDLDEKGWYVMGRALGLLKEDETSPCIDFDPKHPKADEAILLARRLLKIKS